MKKLFYSLMLTACSINGFAQDAIPEFKNKVMLLNSGKNLESLETTSMTTGMKTGIGSGKVFMKADGPKATVVVDPATNEFIVKIDEETDPETIVQLYKFDADKKIRKIMIGAMGMSGVKNTESQTLGLNFKKVQEGVYIISARKPLEPGEYIFIVNQNVMQSPMGVEVKGFAFSVAK